MKIFVTVGTTAFDRLIQVVDDQLSKNFNVISQISSGNYQPVGHPFFEFSDKIDDFYENADLVITHGGAGSIFRLLEMKKKILIVPNLQRVDKHQLEISRYMLKNNHALACYNLEKLTEAVTEAKATFFVPYFFEPFGGTQLIRDYWRLG